MILFCINLCDSPTDSFINVIIKTDRNVNVKSDNYLSIFCIFDTRILSHNR